MLAGLRKGLSYSNVTATIALFIALGGTSWAVLKVDSRNVVDNSLRSADIRNNTIRSHDIRNRTIRAHDIRRNGLGGGVIKERSLARVPNAADADRVGGASVQDLRTRCPEDTVQKGGVCIEFTARQPDGFFGAANRCEQLARGLSTMAQLDGFARSHGPLSIDGEWTSNVFRNPMNGPGLSEQAEAVVLSSSATIDYGRIYTPEQHAFRCVALPSN